MDYGCLFFETGRATLCRFWRFGPLQMASVVCLLFVSNHAVEGSYGAAVERRFSGCCTETLLAYLLIVGDNTTRSALIQNPKCSEQFVHVRLLFPRRRQNYSSTVVKEDLGVQ